MEIIKFIGLFAICILLSFIMQDWKKISRSYKMRRIATGCGRIKGFFSSIWWWISVGFSR